MWPSELWEFLLFNPPSLPSFGTSAPANEGNLTKGSSLQRLSSVSPAATPSGWRTDVLVGKGVHPLRSWTGTKGHPLGGCSTAFRNPHLFTNIYLLLWVTLKDTEGQGENGNRWFHISQSRNGREMEVYMKQKRRRRMWLVFLNWEAWQDLLGRKGESTAICHLSSNTWWSMSHINDMGMALLDRLSFLVTIIHSFL